MVAPATRRAAGTRGRGPKGPRGVDKVYRLTSMCQVCERPIVPGQTWKWTPEGGKVHYYCAETNPEPGYETMKSRLTQEGVAIARRLHPGEFGQPVGWDYFRFKLYQDPEGVVPGWSGMLPQEKQRVEKQLFRAYVREAQRILGGGRVENPFTLDPRHVLRYGTVMVPPRGARPGMKTRATVTGDATYRGVRIWKDAEGWRTALEPESLFDSYRDAKAFVDAQARNPRRRGLYGAGVETLAAGISMASREDPFQWRGLEVYLANGFWWYRNADPTADPYARQWMRVTDPSFKDQISYALRTGGLTSKESNPRRRLVDEVLEEHVRMPGMPQLIVTRAFALRWWGRQGWPGPKHGIGSLDHRVMLPPPVEEPLTDPELRDYNLEGMARSMAEENPASYEEGHYVVVDEDYRVLSGPHKELHTASRIATALAKKLRPKGHRVFYMDASDYLVETKGRRTA